MKKDIVTQLAHLGVNTEKYDGLVNPPAHRASTVILETFDDFQNCFDAEYRYGREGTPSVRAFEHAIATLDNAYGAIATSSGLAAIISVLMAHAKNGAHILIPDNFYGFARDFVETTLADFGVTHSVYAPLATKVELEALITDKTSLIYIEAPGSLTYEIADIGMIVELAKTHNIKTCCDNSWGTPLNHRPLDLGIDISIMSATKYINGHSDIMLGVISCADKDDFATVQRAVRQSGNCPGSEEIYLGLRGLRTLDVRLKKHRESSLELAHMLMGNNAVKKVLHPALPSCLGHENFKKYFADSSGVFAIVLKETDPKRIAKMLDGMELFKMGFSWGGFESLIFPEQLTDRRISQPWDGDGFLMRIHAGLEDLGDLKDDLNDGLTRLSS